MADIDENDDQLPITLESLCVNCQENGTTTMLTRRIPFFKDIMVAHFSCPHCHYTNNSVENIASLSSHGQKITLTVKNNGDLDRQVVVSQYAEVSIPEVDLTIPATMQSTTCSTVEGLIMTVVNNLLKDQEWRAEKDRELAEKIDAFIEKLQSLLNRDQPQSFTLIIDDMSGNSFIENFMAPNSDPQIQIQKYARTKEMLKKMGYLADTGNTTVDNSSAVRGADLDDSLRTSTVASWDLNKPVEEIDSPDVFVFQIDCCNCHSKGTEKMCQIDIPGFRRCLIMAFTCDECGYKTSELKPSGEYGEKGKIWTLRVENQEDLNRDLLKSEMSSIYFKELDVCLEPRTLGGMFTTVEGLIRKVVEEIQEKFPFFGDSADDVRRARLNNIIDKLQSYTKLENLPFTLILDDCTDHSHIGRRGTNILEKDKSMDDTVDVSLTFEYYERTDEHNDMLGLNDMKVENYE